MKLWLANFDPEATDDDLRELLGRYTKLEVGAVTRVAGAGTRPGAYLEIGGAGREDLFEVQRRLNGVYWRNRSLVVYVPAPSTDPPRAA